MRSFAFRMLPYAFPMLYLWNEGGPLNVLLMGGGLLFLTTSTVVVVRHSRLSQNNSTTPPLISSTLVRILSLRHSCARPNR